MGTMIMSDQNIRESIKSGWINIEPFDDAMIQPASIDIRLGDHFTTYIKRDTFRDGMGRYHGIEIDPDEDNNRHTTESVISDGGRVALGPGQFMLGHTMETITLSPRVAARLEGRSSYGRLGLVIHSTAGFIDPGFSGQITLEMSNLAPYPIMLRPGARIGQICFIPLISPATIPYGARAGSKYQGQVGATASRAHQDTY